MTNIKLRYRDGIGPEGVYELDEQHAVHESSAGGSGWTCDRWRVSHSRDGSAPFGEWTRGRGFWSDSNVEIVDDPPTPHEEANMTRTNIGWVAFDDLQPGDHIRWQADVQVGGCRQPVALVERLDQDTWDAGVVGFADADYRWVRAFEADLAAADGWVERETQWVKFNDLRPGDQVWWDAARRDDIDALQPGLTIGERDGSHIWVAAGGPTQRTTPDGYMWSAYDHDVASDNGGWVVRAADAPTPQPDQEEPMATDSNGEENAYLADLRIINDRLAVQANQRGWCSEWEKFVRETNELLTSDFRLVQERRREWVVTIRATVDQDYNEEALTAGVRERLGRCFPEANISQVRARSTTSDD